MQNARNKLSATCFDNYKLAIAHIMDKNTKFSLYSKSLIYVSIHSHAYMYYIYIISTLLSPNINYSTGMYVQEYIIYTVIYTYHYNTYIHTHMHTYVCTYIHTYIYTCMHACI